MQQFEREAIGQRIAQARRESGGMTQPELADVLNVTVRQLQNYEAGETVPWKHFQTLERVFKRPLQWWLHGEEEPAPDAGVVERLDRIEQLVLQVLAQSGPDEQADQA